MMKRLFWLTLGAVIVWYFSRTQMDDLYGEISRLREADRQRDTLSFYN
ncbi:MAG: hypothetical protein AAF846_00170 [Chloroflexota bacterium]